MLVKTCHADILILASIHFVRRVEADRTKRFLHKVDDIDRSRLTQKERDERRRGMSGISEGRWSLRSSSRWKGSSSYEVPFSHDIQVKIGHNFAQSDLLTVARARRGGQMGMEAY